MSCWRPTWLDRAKAWRNAPRYEAASLMSVSFSLSKRDRRSIAESDICAAASYAYAPSLPLTV